MRNALQRIVLIIVLASSLLAGCGGSLAETPPAGEAGLQISLSTVPVTPGAGKVELVIHVKDADGRPVSGARVTLKADMIGHTMGDLSGQATDQGNGQYATTANFAMVGAWQVDVQVQTAGEDVRRVFRIEVN